MLGRVKTDRRGAEKGVGTRSDGWFSCLIVEKDSGVLSFVTVRAVLLRVAGSSPLARSSSHAIATYVALVHLIVTVSF